MDYKSKIEITSEMIWKIFPAVNSKRGRENKVKNINGFVYTFNKYADYFAIDTPLEVRHFIAQIAHESDQFNAYEEYAPGSDYENRKDLGNVFKGDGVKFKGRGPIQITGRNNYKKMGSEIAKLPFLTDQERKIFQNDGLLKDPAKLQDSVWGTLWSYYLWVDTKAKPPCSIFKR
jgi:predicted chitinase